MSGDPSNNDGNDFVNFSDDETTSTRHMNSMLEGKAYSPVNADATWVFTLRLCVASIVLGLFFASLLIQLFEFQEYQIWFTRGLTSLFVFSSVVWWRKWSDYGGSTLSVYDRFRSLPFPSLFLSIGVLGTFLGIFLGLTNLRLDTTNPFNSEELRGLVEALSFSMTTSLLGITYAILFRVLETVFGPEVNDVSPVQEIVASIESMSEKLDDFIHDLANKVGEGLTDALQDLTSRLDSVLADQLGQAFRDLNESICKLNEWVETYRDQIDRLTVAYRDNLVGIQTFHDEAEKITHALALVPQQTEGIQQTLEKMNIPLGEFSKLGSQAKEALPTIERALEGMTRQFDDSSSELKEALTKLSALQQELADKTGDVESLVKAATEKQLADFGQQLAAISERFAEDYVPIADALRRVLQTLDARQVQ